MESHTQSLIKEVFDTHDLYEILGVPNNCDSTLIKQAYRKLALKYHPDRQNGDSKKFQALSAVHCILSDPTKRALYDKNGLMDSDDNDKNFDEWYEYFRNLFPTITVADLDSFAEKYRGSSEEENDIIELYKKFNGDVFMMYNYIMCSDDDSAEQRICNIIDKNITSNKLQSTKLYTSKKQSFLQQNSKRLKAQKKRKVSKENDSCNNLESLIKARQASRGNMLANIASKYGVNLNDLEEEDDEDDDEKGDKDGENSDSINKRHKSKKTIKGKKMTSK